MTCCSVCGFEKTTCIQYIYDKCYKDDCKTCLQYNHTDIIYCLCNNNNNFIHKQKINICNHCSFCKNDFEDQSCLLNKELSIQKKVITQSYKDLYTIAKNKNIKYRSLMSKEELYYVIFSNVEHCNI